MVDPYRKLPIRWDSLHREQKVSTTVTAVDKTGEKITFEWGFVVSELQYPTLGTDFLTSTKNYEGLTADHMILNINDKKHHIELYLSKAFNCTRDEHNAKKRRNGYWDQ